MKKILIMFVAIAFIAFGFTPAAFAGLGKSMSDKEIGPHEYYESNEGISEDFDANQDTDTHGYFGTDEGVHEGFDADRDLDTRGYFGSDEDINEGFDADRDLDTRGGAGLDERMESEESVDSL